MVEFDELIKGGTSGSAIVNDEGEIVALVSIAGGTVDPDQETATEIPFIETGCYGPSPRPHMALPVWAVKHIEDASEPDEDPPADDLLIHEIKKLLLSSDK